MNKEASLYSDRVTLRFYEKTHRYMVNTGDGFTPVPSVTTVGRVVNKVALQFWRDKLYREKLREMVGKPFTEASIVEVLEEPKRQMEQAASVGTEVHNALEAAALGRKPKLVAGSKAEHAFSEFMKWKSQHDIKVIEAEAMLYSKSHHFCGQADLIAEIDGVLTIADYKTSKGVYPDYFRQLGAYALAANEEGRYGQIQRTLVIKIPKEEEGDFQTAERLGSEIDDDADWFLTALKLFNIEKEREKEFRK